MKRFDLFWVFQLLLTTGLVFCAGCAHTLSTSPSSSNSMPSPTATSAPVTYTPAQADDMLSSNLSQRCNSTSPNVVFSPFSIITALAMAQEGAVGNTATQMQQVLNLNSNATIRQQGFQQLMNAINSPNNSYTLSTANNVWVQQGFSILPSFTNTLQTYYEASVANVDMAGNPTAALQTINGAVSTETAGNIPDLLSSIPNSAKLFLTNAVYFQANWSTGVGFQTTNTMPGSFTLNSGNTETVNYMNTMFKAVVGNFNGAASVLAIPYQNDQASMYVFLPPVGGMSALLNAMSGTSLSTWLSANSAAMTSVSTTNPLVSLHLPKFTFSEGYQLANTLSQMGMPLAFTKGQANFSGIDGTTDLFIGEVVHQAYINVNELGTTAAAATAVGIVVQLGIATMPLNSVPFNADHPFVFAIVDNATNTVLFMGEANDPLSN